MHTRGETAVSLSRCLSRVLRRAAGTWWLLAWLAMPMPAAAQSCWVGNVGDFNFGQADLHAPTDTSLGITYTCQSDDRATYFRVCMYIAQGTPIPGIAPRWMTNYNGSLLAYDLYTDAARTQIVGPPPSGGGYSAVVSSVVAPGGYVQVSPTVTVYGRIPGNQSVPGQWDFQSQLGGSALSWAWSHAGIPPSCTTGAGGTGDVSFYTSAAATVSTSCRISQVNDLDFGSVSSVSSQVDSTSRVIVRCPKNDDWNLGLDNGLNTIGGSRHMRSAASNYVRYEMYRDAARTRRWGNTVGIDTVSGTGAGDDPQSVTVYGRVPPQPAQPAGVYTDTVTITLTY